MTNTNPTHDANDEIIIDFLSYCESCAVLLPLAATPMPVSPEILPWPMPTLDWDGEETIQPRLFRFGEAA